MFRAEKLFLAPPLNITDANLRTQILDVMKTSYINHNELIKQNPIAVGAGLILTMLLTGLFRLLDSVFSVNPLSIIGIISITTLIIIIITAADDYLRASTSQAQRRKIMLAGLFDFLGPDGIRQMHQELSGLSPSYRERFWRRDETDLEVIKKNWLGICLEDKASPTPARAQFPLKAGDTIGPFIIKNL